MKKFIFTLIMLFVCGAAYGQPLKNIFSMRDTLTSTDASATNIDTLLYSVDFSEIDFSDTSMATYALYRIDTLLGDTASTRIWKDSSYIPKVTIEYRYIVDVSYRSPSDTLNGNGLNGQGQWISITDSVNSISGWGWSRVKLLPISPRGEVRIRDVGTAKKGPRHGKWISFIWRAKKY